MTLIGIIDAVGFVNIMEVTMLKKSFVLLKSNPLLIILFILAVLAYAVPMFFFLPETRKILELSKGIAENPGSASYPDFPQMTAIMLSTMKMYLFMLVLGVLAIVFIAGYGNMLAAAVNGGKASFKVFLFGIRKLFGKVILSALLFLALVIAFSIIISICILPFTIAGMVTSNMQFDKMLRIQNTIQIITIGISAFLYPFLELWLPAIFLERNEGVIACFRKGLKAGLHKYLKLMVVTAVILLPLIALYAFSGNIYSIVESPLYMLSFVYQAIVVPVLMAYLFILYQNSRVQPLPL